MGKYLMGETIGKGATSKVKLGLNEATGENVALKILTGGNFSQSELKKEIGILQELDHPNVIRVYDYFDNVEAVGATSSGKQLTTTVIVLELATKGEFFDFFMYTGKFQAPLARWFFKQMIEGLDYCHKKKISHRDLKPENCLLGDGYQVKLVDFGFARAFGGEGKADHKMLTALGTPGYAAPEILKRQKYTENVDIFSLGVILFITIAGFPPFQEAKPDEDWWFNKIKNKKYDLFWKAHERTAEFTDEAKEILLGMLMANPDERWTIEQIRQCKWWQGKTFTQAQAIHELEKRKAKVASEKLSKQKDPTDGVVSRGADPFIVAPPMGNYRPGNLFYTTPGKHADTIRAQLMHAVSQMAMAKTEVEYYGTGTGEKPERPDDVDEKEWKPWWDFTFSCQLAETETVEGIDASDLPPPMSYPFTGGVYIREDTTYKPPAETPEFRRHIVYFKRHKGLPHKWIKVLFKLQMLVGFLNAQTDALPSAIPVLAEMESSGDGEDEGKESAE